MSKMRESTGGGFQDRRGRFFIRVTVAPQKRAAELAPWATSLEETVERGKVVQALVNRLRVAGQREFIKTIVEFGGRGPVVNRGQPRRQRKSAGTQGPGKVVHAVSDEVGSRIRKGALVPHTWARGMTELDGRMPSWRDRMSGSTNCRRW